MMHARELLLGPQTGARRRTAAGRRGLVGWLLTAALVMSGLVTGALSSQAVEQVPFSVTIRHISCVDPCDAEGLEDAVVNEQTPDFYAKVWINGAKVVSDPDAPSTSVIDDDDSIDPIWTVTGSIPVDLDEVPVGFQVWDEDTFDDDLADISPAVNDNGLDLVYTRSTGTWVGAADGILSPRNCSTGGGGGDNDQPRAKLCFDIGGDRDGDGLLDGWETVGYDHDGDGVVDVDLPAMGADPDHKDLFVEIDTDGGVVPTRAGVLATKRAFAAAPMNAGARAGEREGFGDLNEDFFGRSAPPNPDGVRGITLHVDAGALPAPGAREGQAAGTCTDGTDNGSDGVADGADPDCYLLDGSVEDAQAGNCTGNVDDDLDGLTDLADPDCLVGDAVFADPALGRGRVLTLADAAQPCGVDSNFYAIKNGTDGFDPVRRHLFRYTLSTTQRSTCTPQSGGQAEGGGNDLTLFNAGSAWGGTFMHELGHTLNLHHGGHDDDNCKPNYVSVMNYDLQVQIPRVGGGGILDYSPPRVALDGAARGRAPLGLLDEDELDESAVPDSTDIANEFVFVNELGAKIKASLALRPDWSGTPPVYVEHEVNVDTVGMNGRPAACGNDDFDDLEGAEDWVFVSLSFHGFGEASDAAVGPVDDQVPTTEDFELLHQELNTTDLVVTLTDTPDPVAAGTNLTYGVTVRNDGANPADGIQVIQTLPSGLSLSSSTGGCTAEGQQLTCSHGALQPGGQWTYSVVSSVAPDLVYVAGAPVSASSTATVSNLHGPDADASDNSATVSTRVVAVADVSLGEPTASGPLEVLIGQSADVGLALPVSNAGPSSPIDAVVTTTASGSAGIILSPGNVQTAVTALRVGTPQQVQQSVSLTCTAPGSQTVGLSSVLALKNAVDTDPNLTNNTRTSSLTVDCVVPIAINIRPHGFPNSINLNTDATLAALRTEAGEYGLPWDFQATAILASTARFGLATNLFDVATPTGAAEQHERIHPADSYELDERTRDRDLDAILHFRPSDSGLTLDSTEGCLKGRYVAPDGSTYTFFGCDSVRMTN